MRLYLPTVGLVVALSVTWGVPTYAAENPFSATKRILEQHCVECHGGASTKAGFDLTTREGLVQGGDSGSAFDPTNPDGSVVLKRVRHTEEPGMPFKRPKLSDAEIAALTVWFKAGANYDAPLTRPTAETWWSLKPLAAPVPPAVPDEWRDVVANPVDQFVLARLQSAGLKPSPQADRRTLLRRVAYDLIGLPPTLEEVEAFVNDPSPTAYEEAVDRLLASPHYGERWARHWMDVVHYAETHGHDQDRIRPNAWPYRDYLIRAFNTDTPYARFIQEQLAGDVLFPDDGWATVALGMLATGPWDESSLMSIRDDTIDKKIAQYLDRDDMLTTAMASFTSTTVHCARCHAHKFDPIPQVDYYRLQAVFAGVDKAERPYPADPQIEQLRRQLKAEQARLESLRGKSDPSLLTEAVQARAAAWEKALASNARLWTPLEMSMVDTANFSTLTRQPDGSYLASATRPEKETYTFVSQVTLPQITGLRLEVLTDDSLPHKGPGRQDNGNLHLSEIRVLAGAAGETGKPVVLQNPQADFNQQGWTIQHAIDGNPATAWGIHPAVGQPHRAAFEFKEPLKGPVQLTIILEQLHGQHHLIGRPRLSVTSAPTPLPLEADLLPPEVTAVVATALADRTELQKATLARYVEAKRVDQQLAALPAPPMVYAAANDFKAAGSFSPAGPKPRPIHLLRRGDVNKPEEVVGPGALTCIPGLPGEFTLSEPNREGLRRAALAKWISDPKNVLTWRSIANRVWHYHFGRGLCDTPNDLGRMGGVPSHPELIDWLAVRLLESGGSLKSLHRLIVTSRTYQQASTSDPQAAAVDGDNRLLWRMNRSRLDAEAIRDSILVATGKLDQTMGGPSVKQFIESPGVQVTPNVDYAGFDPDRPENYRRSTYRFIFRTLADPFMETLDCPDSSQLAPTRNVSVSALQALSMLNNRFVVRQSEHLAARASALAPDLPSQIDAAYCLLLARHATEKEKAAVTAYATRHGLSNACRVLLNGNEFLFVD